VRRGGLLVGLLSPHEPADGLVSSGVTAFRHGAAAAHLARAGDGRAVVAGNIAGYKAVLVAAYSTAASCRC
jgi:hypothetical protein